MRTTGYFGGQSTAVVEILQSSAPGQQVAPLYFAGQSTAVVEILQSSVPGQQAAPLISQRLTLFFCGAAVRVKKVEQTALACQQPQLLPTMLPTAPAATDHASDIYT